MAAVGSPCCPHCDGEVTPEVPFPFGTANCSRCGKPLWFLTIDGSLAFFRYAEAKFVWKLFMAILDHQQFPPGFDPDTFDAIEVIADFKAELESA
jgi:hypothetical protein